MNPVDDKGQRIQENPAGGPPLDYWEISPGGYRGAHYAVFPPKLCEIPIESMVPREVCTGCGTPRRRITERTQTNPSVRGARSRDMNGRGRSDGTVGHEGVSVETLGWADCGCGAPFRPGVVLDPFAGTGTTLAVATGHGRDAIGIDIDERNADLARERVGMFLEVAPSAKVSR